jgi:hypothetical protein
MNHNKFTSYTHAHTCQNIQFTSTLRSTFTLQSHHNTVCSSFTSLLTAQGKTKKAECPDKRDINTSFVHQLSVTKVYPATLTTLQGQNSWCMQCEMGVDASTTFSSPLPPK